MVDLETCGYLTLVLLCVFGGNLLWKNVNAFWSAASSNHQQMLNEVIDWQKTSAKDALVYLHLSPLKHDSSIPALWINIRGFGMSYNMEELQSEDREMMTLGNWDPTRDV